MAPPKNPLSPSIKSPSSFLRGPVVETTKVDPATFKDPTKDLVSNLEPIASAPAAAAPSLPRIEQEPLPPPPPKKEEPVISNSILASLVEEYGFEPRRLHRLELQSPASPKPLIVEVRGPNWDDHNWGMLHLQRQFDDPSLAVHVQDEGQRTRVYGIANACRCVVKINDRYVWDIFGLRDTIEKANPRWTGDTHIGVPEVIWSVLAEAVLDFFRRRIHPDYGVVLDDKMQDLQRRVASSDEDDSADEEENPTPAT